MEHDARNTNMEVPIFEILQYYWRQKIWIVGFVFLSSVCAAFVSLTLPNQYTADVVFVSSKQGTAGDLSSLSGALGGIASLAGLDANAGGDPAMEAEFLLTSDSFLMRLVIEHDLFSDIVAALDFDIQTSKIKYDEESYDSDRDEWKLDDAKLNREYKRPADWLVLEKLRSMIELRKNDSTNIYTLSVQHYSPIFAQKFASLMMSEINEHMRAIHQSNIDSRLSFLDKQLAVTKPDELNRALYTLVEQELKRKMMVESEHEYIFRVLEGPLLPVLKSSPRRAFIVIVTTISSVFIAVITLALVFLYRRHSKEGA